MGRVLRLLDKIIGLFDKILSTTKGMAALLLGGAWVIVCLAIAIRLFSRTISTGWFIEIVEYCLLWSTFVGAAWLLREEGHVRIDLLLNRLSPRTQAILNTITSIIGGILCLFMTWFSLQKTLDLFHSGILRASNLEPPIYMIVMIIPIGMLLLSIQFGRRTYRNLKLWLAK